MKFGRIESIFYSSVRNKFLGALSMIDDSIKINMMLNMSWLMTIVL